MRRLICIWLAVCLLLSLGGCSYDYSDYIPTGGGLADGKPQDPTQPDNGDKIITLTYYKEKGLNPYLCTDYTNRVLMSLLYQGLFATDSSYHTTPVLCDSYTPSPDYMTHIFTVDPKATYSDGTRVTARDVVASLNAAKESAYYAGRLLHITSITLSDEERVVIYTDTAMGNLPILLDIPIVPSSQVSADMPIGSGPYMLEDTVVGCYLKKRTSWWCQAVLQISTPAIPLMEAASVSGIRDDFQFNGLDFALTDPSSDKYVDYRSDAEMWNCESGLFLYIGCNEDSTVFDSPELRAALTYAIDRDSLAGKFYRGFAQSATLPASPHSPYYNKALAGKYGYDAAKFAEAVTASGKQGSTVVLLVNSDDTLRLQAARAIGDMLSAGGFVVEMKELGGTAYENAIKRREFDLYLGKTRLSPNMDLSAFFYTWGELSYGGIDDLAAYTLCLEALADEGNYYNLHRTVMEQGLLCPVLFCNYTVYTTRGLFSDLSPARDNVFCYSIGKAMGDIMP
ncbi:MAG: ABC transporter substrate-binding protein [Oscillospiraceae bacterium]|nr:ABC transporter substrate-binding protein [Oscillospiraceae bacterium]